MPSLTAFDSHTVGSGIRWLGLFVITLRGLAAGISVLARAIRARHRRAIAASAAGLAAIIAAAFSGAAFVSNGQAASASMAMAVLTGAALLCYLANLLIVGPVPAIKE